MYCAYFVIKLCINIMYNEKYNFAIRLLYAMFVSALRR